MRIRQRGSVSRSRFRSGPAVGTLSISPLLVARIALGAFGVWVGSIGLRALLRGHPFAANAPVGRWLVSGVLAHDAVIAPTVFLLGAVTVRLAGPRTRQALAAILLIGGSVLIVGLPDVLRKGHNANSTVTPLNYTRNLLIVLLAVVAGVVLTTAASALRQRRRDRPAPEPVAVPTEPTTDAEETEPEAEAEAGPVAQAAAANDEANEDDTDGTESTPPESTQAEAARTAQPASADSEVPADPRDEA